MSVSELDKLKARLEKVNAAIDNSLNVKEYSLDSGLGKERVVKQELKDLLKLQESLETKIAILENGGGYDVIVC